MIGKRYELNDDAFRREWIRLEVENLSCVYFMTYKHCFDDLRILTDHCPPSLFHEID